MKNIVVFDIDGCVINSEHRIQHLMSGDIDKYHELWYLDKPIAPGVLVYRTLLQNTNIRPLFITGRPERARRYTKVQLTGQLEVHIPDNMLLMRPDGLTGADEHDSIMKPRLLAEAGYRVADVLLVFEDRNSVVDAWRQLGVHVYQTAPGDF